MDTIFIWYLDVWPMLCTVGLLLLVRRVLVRLGILVGCAFSLVCCQLHKFFHQCLVCRFAGRLDGFVCDQIHQNTNSIDNRENPSSALPTGHFIDPHSPRSDPEETAISFAVSRE